LKLAQKSLLVFKLQNYPIAKLQNRYFTSLCGVCFRQRGQNLLNSSRSVVVLRFLVVE
jgi:hypothetical protein